jgi:hypothetical protein
MKMDDLLYKKVKYCGNELRLDRSKAYFVWYVNSQSGILELILYEYLFWDASIIRLNSIDFETKDFAIKT